MPRKEKHMVGGIRRQEMVFCSFPHKCPLRNSCLRNKDLWDVLPLSMNYENFRYRKTRCPDYLPVEKIQMTPKLASMLQGNHGKG